MIEMFEFVQDSYVLAYFGMFCTFLFAIILFLKIFNMIRIHLFTICGSNLKSCGEWAVITGGSSGIGKCFSFELAKLGFDIVIISNELDALKETAEEIINKYGRQCCYIHVDLADENVFKFIGKKLSDKKISISINGAGIAGDAPCYFLEESDKNLLLMINLHIGAVVHMTRLILPSMLARNRGVIINISSVASAKPFSFVSTYSACKAFSDRFTRSVIYENINEKVSLQSLTPSFVWTNMVKKSMKGKNKKASEILKLMSLSPNNLVRNAVRIMNVTKHTTGHWLTDLFWDVYPNVPNFVWMVCNFIMAPKLRGKVN